MSVEWSYFDKFDGLTARYLPYTGEGETMATQIVTAVSKLVYKWYNDGDVFDNTGYMEGWCNNLSSYANWLNEHTAAGLILCNIWTCRNESDYEDLLKELADFLLDEKFLEKMDACSKVGSIYDCDGPFEFVDYDDEDEWDEEV